MDDSRGEDLSSIRPEDWANIPAPIVRAIGVVIKRLKSQEQDISIISQSFHSSEQKVDGKFQQFMNKFDSVWSTIADIDEKISQPRLTPKSGKPEMNDPFGEMTQTVNQMKNRVKDLEKQTKDLKLQQLKLDEKILTTAGELAKSIETARDELRQEVSQDMLGPAIALQEEKLSKLEESSNSFSLELKKNFDNLAFSSDIMKKEQGQLSKDVLKLRELQDDSAIEIRHLTSAAERLDVRLKQVKTKFEEELGQLAYETRSSQSKIVSDAAAQMTDLRQMVEAASSLSDSFFSTKIKEFADSLIFPILTKQRIDIETAIVTVDSKLRQELFILSKNLQNAFKKSIIEGVERKIVILEEKLKWLPLDMQEIKNMTPYEARLFTLEARLRTEEDRRLLAQERISSDLDYLRRTVSPISIVRPETTSTNRNPMSQIFANDFLPKSVAKKPTVSTPGGMATPEIWRKISPKRQSASQLAVRSKKMNLASPYDIPDSKESQAEMQQVYQNFTPTKYHTVRSTDTSLNYGHDPRKYRAMSNFTEPLHSESAMQESERLDLSSF
mmetsp:Transcript_28689/g.51072  ORF Transcript_28689/g.51072 Transcript_28689/m.51072 type:complete len:556 (+) Transcript_28689:309-1976(+)